MSEEESSRRQFEREEFLGRLAYPFGVAATIVAVPLFLPALPLFFLFELAERSKIPGMIYVVGYATLFWIMFFWVAFLTWLGILPDPPWPPPFGWG